MHRCAARQAGNACAVYKQALPAVQIKSVLCEKRRLNPASLYTLSLIHIFVRRYCRQDVWVMWFKVLVAVLPAMVIGLPLDDWMTEHLHNPPVVAAMLILYGVLFIVGESSPRRVKMVTVESLSSVSYTHLN